MTPWAYVGADARTAYWILIAIYCVSEWTLAYRMRASRSDHNEDRGSLRVLVLDTTRPGQDAGELGAERLEWLDAELSAAPELPTLVAMHHPPLAVGIAQWDAIGLPAGDRDALGTVIRRHPQVRRLVAGHVHRTIASDLGGRAVLAVPSTYVQAKLDLGSDEIALGDEPPGFAVHVLVGGELISHIQPVG